MKEEFPGPADGGENKAEQSVEDFIRESVSFPRVEIVSEDEDRYQVEFDGKEYSISKGDEAENSGGSSSGEGMGMGLRLEQRQYLISGVHFGHDESYPVEFREVVMFHEISERAYSDAGFKDAHDRAVHDEILYVLKYFEPAAQKRYVEFAKEVRAAALRVGLERQNKKFEEQIEDLIPDSSDFLGDSRLTGLFPVASGGEAGIKKAEYDIDDFIRRLKGKMRDGEIEAKSFPELKAILLKKIPRRVALNQALDHDLVFSFILENIKSSHWYFDNEKLDSLGESMRAFWRAGKHDAGDIIALPEYQEAKAIFRKFVKDIYDSYLSEILKRIEGLDFAKEISKRKRNES